MDGLHYADAESGERSDELDIAEVRALIAAGTITDETLVWADGMDEWQPLSECRHNFAGLDQDDDAADASEAGALYSTLHYETADGPSDEISTAQVAGLLADGSLTEETLVWIEGMAEWTPLSEARQLFVGLSGDAPTGGEAAEAETASGLLTTLYFELGPDSMSEETTVSFATMLAEEGDITAVTNVFSEGWEGWIPLGECQHMFAELCDVQLQPGPQSGGEAEEHQQVSAEVDELAPAEGIPGMVHAFYYQISEDEQSDEIATSAIAAMLADGTLTESTRIWAEGMEGWTPLSECTEIIEGLDAALSVDEPSLMYEKDGETPEVSMDVALSLIASGTLTEETLVWTEGFHNWTPLGDCAESFPRLAGALAAAASEPASTKPDGADVSTSESALDVAKTVGAQRPIGDVTGETTTVPDAFYYVTAAGTHSAKVPVTRIPSLFKSETLSLESMVWTEGMQQWYKLGDCMSKLAGLQRVLDQLSGASGSNASRGKEKQRTMSLPEKKQLYAELVRKIVSGDATASDTIDAERLGSELEKLEADSPGAVDDSVQGSALVLSKLAIFETLTDEQCLMVARSMERCEYESGDVIFEEGDHGDFFYIVEHGGVKVVKHRASRDETVLKQIDHGGYFGELALLSRNPRAASCVATAKATKLLRVSRVGFDRALGPMVKLIRKGMEQAGARARPEPPNLIAACMYGSCQKVEQFLASERPIGGAGAIVEQGNRITLLHVAASLGHVDVVRFLLQNGAQIDGASKAGSTALHMAAREGRTQVVQLLCSSNAMVSSKTAVGGATPIFLAAQGGHVKVMNILIKHRADSKASCGASKTTPLHVAAERGHFDVVSFLLTGNRANVNQTDGDGATALHYAAAYGNASVVWRLLERGAQPNSVLPNGATAFFLAAQNGHSPVLQLLLSLPGVDPHAKVTNSSGEAVR
jgi:ankyrin repeat protein